MFVFTVTGVGTIWDFFRLGLYINMDNISLVPFEHSSNKTFFILNIIMTIPLGIIIAYIWPKYRNVLKVALIDLSFSFLIELSQLLNHRATTLEDLIANTTGAIFGYLLFIPFSFLFKKHNEPIDSPIMYIILSFLGVFLFYNPLLFIRLFALT
jgi:glycopeptide antibiotics resistance protein